MSFQTIMRERTTIRSQPLYALTVSFLCEGEGYRPDPEPVQPSAYTSIRRFCQQNCEECASNQSRASSSNSGSVIFDISASMWPTTSFARSAWCESRCLLKAPKPFDFPVPCVTRRISFAPTSTKLMDSKYSLPNLSSS